MTASLPWASTAKTSPHSLGCGKTSRMLDVALTRLRLGHTRLTDWVLCGGVGELWVLKTQLTYTACVCPLALTGLLLVLNSPWDHWTFPAALSALPLASCSTTQPTPSPEHHIRPAHHAHGGKYSSLSATHCQFSRLWYPHRTPPGYIQSQGSWLP